MKVARSVDEMFACCFLGSAEYWINDRDRLHSLFSCGMEFDLMYSKIMAHHTPHLPFEFHSPSIFWQHEGALVPKLTLLLVIVQD